jgi:hypothetical protein
MSRKIPRLEFFGVSSKTPVFPPLFTRTGLARASLRGV